MKTRMGERARAKSVGRRGRRGRRRKSSDQFLNQQTSFLHTLHTSCEQSLPLTGPWSTLAHILAHTHTTGTPSSLHTLHTSSIAQQWSSQRYPPPVHPRCSSHGVGKWGERGAKTSPAPAFIPASIATVKGCVPPPSLQSSPFLAHTQL